MPPAHLNNETDFRQNTEFALGCHKTEERLTPQRFRMHEVSKSGMVSAPAQAQGAMAPLVDPLMAEHFLRPCDPPASVSGVSGITALHF